MQAKLADMFTRLHASRAYLQVLTARADAGEALRGAGTSEIRRMLIGRELMREA